MASRFVSGGTNEEPTERDEAWLTAQKEIDAKRVQEKVAASQQDGGKSLYETLQANKAAKQDAFEESIRLRNQFRSLDEDEVEFLDSVLESTRAKEAEVRKETSQQLDAFRELQREAEKNDGQQDAEPAVEGAETWTSGPRKRKKGRESVIGGVKLRRVSTNEKQAVSPTAVEGERAEKRSGVPSPDSTEKKLPTDDATSASINQRDTTSSSGSLKGVGKTQPPPEPEKKGDEVPKPSSPPTVGLGLAAYSSDEDEGD